MSNETEIDYESALADLRTRERRAKRRRLRWVRAIAIALAVLAIIALFTVQYRAFRVAAVPGALSVLTLKALDPDWLTTNQRFTIGLVVAVLGAAVARLLTMLVF